ncbi:nuclear transport factor 2 family protein [Sphingosinicella rhizophila]|uniref:Nuclear transport factor 2 family protein n=1 Tax=Sphingosinicella rhizophila TaxID=3050082 RepID=A0ABU3QAV6_9SPHN|nr:nuclear transport factor 2 family protein [Sphingosinicella sp. GR2756]MDT9600536.1 nuclear transport factor 2 family protein [Sphingosinicella sp. GR2756]
MHTRLPLGIKLRSENGTRIDTLESGGVCIRDKGLEEWIGMAHPPELQHLIDWHQIYAVLTKYSRGLDRLDLDLMKEVYWPDGTDDHGVFRGNAHEYCAFMIDFARQSWEITQHNIGNVSIDIDDNNAFSECYLTAYHRITGDPEKIKDLFGNAHYDRYKDAGAEKFDYIHGGRYLDTLEKRDGVWRIFSRVVTMEWNIVQPTSDVWKEGVLSTLEAIGTRDRTDLVYRKGQ